MKTVLFVCYHNSGRSQMAQAFLDRLAADRGLPIQGISAGTVSAHEINPIVREAMAELGYTMEGQRPKQLMQWHIDNADRIITMHCTVDPERCPSRVIGCEDWELQDPAGEPIEIVRAIRDEVLRRVKLLLDEMTAVVLAES